MQVLVAGASGFVGTRLCPALIRAGHAVRAMTRRPGGYSGPGEAVYGDVHDVESLRAALSGCDAAYYLVHSLPDDDFARRDARAARAFGRVAAEVGLDRIVYLGGLGDDRDELSAHLRSRREVGQLLGCAGVPVTTLRAGIVVGSGSVSWEMIRQLVERLPAVMAPNWIHTRTQPIAVADTVRYLVGVLCVPEAADRAFDIGGADVLTYADMLHRASELENRPTLVVPVPLLSQLLQPPLSWCWPAETWVSLSLWLTTDVDVATGRALVYSMGNEVLVRDDSIRELVAFEPMSYDQAVRAALDERAMSWSPT